MHCKLEKFAGMSKGLSDESLVRSEEAISLRRELDDVRAERDDMAAELQRLRAQVRLQEQEKALQKEMRASLRRMEVEGLDRAASSIQVRDKLTVDLAMRLEQALDTLEVEREAQRQRRQIIFPVARTHSSGDDLAQELKDTKEELRASQAMLESVQAEAERREVALRVQCEHLQEQLRSEGKSV